jgi:hypothetical protein
LGNNFAVEDVKAYDLALANLNSKLLNETNTDLRFIEFSRIKYDSAFKQFSDEVLKRSILIEMCCPFDICVKRNLSRKYAYASDDPDDHCVPDFVMEKYKEAENYDYEDFFKTVPFLNYTRFDNFKTRAELEQQLEKYFKEVLLRNISQK